jgi:hypothetical protein
MITQTHNPYIFPQNDNRWKELFDIKRYNKKHWLYTNKEGEVLFGVIRHETLKDGKPDKSIFQFSYNGKEYVNTNSLKNRPLYKAHLIDSSSIDWLIVEGEKTCDVAQEMFPDYFVTTWSGGCKNWKNTDWSIVPNNRSITIWPDADKGGVLTAVEIAQHLNDKFKIKAKVVDLPNTLPEKWDLADPIPDEVDPLALIRKAIVPDPKGIWEDIDQDIKEGRWVFIQDSFKLYWDRKNQEMIKADTLNLMYKRTQKKIGVAVSYLHENDIQVVNGTAYWPIDQEILRMDSKSYLNSYYPNNISVLSPAEATSFNKKRVQYWRDHLLNVLCNGNLETFNYLEDTIAHDLQKPHENRTFAWVFSSKQGVGKTLFFKLLTKLHGHHNVAWVGTDNLVDKYRSFMKHCYVIICNEIDISGQGKSAKLDKLKELITEDIHPIEQKYVDTINHRGHYRLYASSNKIIPLSVDPNDRRIAFININASREELVKDDPQYFERLWKDLEDRNFIREAYHYYTKLHKISSTFNKNEPIVTESKKALMSNSRPQTFKDLDELMLLREGCFREDFVNQRDILTLLRILDGQEHVRVKIYSRIDEQVITAWFHDIGAESIWNDKVISVIGCKKTNRKRYKAIRNISFWSSCNDINLIRAHAQGKFDPIKDKHVDKQKLESELKPLAQGQGTYNHYHGIVEQDSTSVF